jgi:uncharacterized membrane protein
MSTSRLVRFAFAFGALGLFAAAPTARADEVGPAKGAGPVDLQNATCPVKGTPVAPGVTETVNNTVVHFCCSKCAAKYRENPGAYEKALRADPGVARRMDDARPAPGTAAAPAGHPLHDGMRMLWEDHVGWTRLFIVSTLGDLEDKDFTTKRLLRNQADLGDAIKPFYGEEAGTKLAALLKDHILVAADVVGAAKAGDDAKLQAASTKWAANADEIATFLSGANPTAWPLDATKSMMKEHLDLTTQEVTARLGKNWDAEIATYEKVRDQALHMADMLSDGVAKQFPQKTSPLPPKDSKPLALRDAMRKLWEDHVLWTRLFIVSTLADLEDKDAVTKRLLANQDDLGNAIQPFYGDEAAGKLTTLLKEHIGTAAEIVTAAKAKDAAKLTAAKAKWTANGDEIAAFLSGANPSAWPLDASKAMMKEHLDLTTAELEARLAKNWDADIAAYAKIREQALRMADMLSDGILKQFPEKVR